LSKKLSALFIGDSLTEWFPLERYYPGVRIINEGIAGDTTYGVLERLDMLAEIDADRIFLMIGINDVFNGFGQDDIIENQELIIEQILTHVNGTELIVQALLPVSESMLGLPPGHLNSSIRHINRELRAHCKARGLTFLDLYPAFLEDGEMKREYTTDGGHLSPAGYALWAAKLKPYLE
jgi:lysophospholipase L1-like esterase